MELLSYFADGYSVENRHIVGGQKVCEIADHLIANGVTFATDNNVGSKWIPVSERLPGIGGEYCSGENPNPVLYMMKSTKTIYAGYYGEGGICRDKYFRQYHNRFEGVDADDVLCWMWQNDLPEPPKGE